MQENENFNIRINNSNLKQIALKEEQRLLAICLKSKEKIADAISRGVKTGDDGTFWNKEPRMLWTLIAAYFDKYKNILTKTAIESLTETIQIDGQKLSEDNKMSLRLYWDKIYNLESSEEDFELLLNNVQSRFEQWRAYLILKSGLESVMKSENGQRDLITAIKTKFAELSVTGGETYDKTVSIQDGIFEALEYAKDRRDHPERRVTVTTGIKAIDEVLNGGLEKGSYTVVSGMINGGKSTLMMNVAFNMAKSNHHVVYVSIEKKALPIYVRLLALHALVDYNRIKKGGNGDKGLNEETFSLLEAAYEDISSTLKDKFFVVQVAQGVSLTKILSMTDGIRHHIKRSKNKELEVLVVDYLGVIGTETVTPGRPDLDEYKVSQRLQGYGRVHNLVTITGSQLKTPSSKDIRAKVKKISDGDTKGFEINTEDNAGSKGIIADADNAWGVALNQDYPPTKMYVFFTKARDDQARKTVCLDFDGRLGRVSDTDNFSFLETDSLVYDKKTTVEAIENKEEMALFNSKAVEQFNRAKNVPEVTNIEAIGAKSANEEFKVTNDISDAKDGSEDPILDDLFD